MGYLLSSAFRSKVPEEYRELLLRLDDVALDAALVRIVESLPEDSLHEFEAALTLSDSRVLESFLAQKIPNLRSILGDTLSEIQNGASGMIAILES